MYGERKPPQKPPCDTCREEANEENQDAIKIFFLTRSQVLMTASGAAIEISHEAVHRAMELYQVQAKRTCFEKVLTLGHWWIDRMNSGGE